MDIVKIASLLILCVAVLPTYAMAKERVVWGKVTNVEPKREFHTTEPATGCEVAKPQPSEGLAEVLRWDLQIQCAYHETSRTTAYRVEYRWDGRTYTQTMDKHPGTRIPLLLNLR
jgi:uncharacterized protein YcfJ